MENEVMVSLGEKIQELIEEKDDKKFAALLDELKKWKGTIGCHYTKGFSDAIIVSLQDNNADFSREALLKRYKQMITIHIKQPKKF